VTVTRSTTFVSASDGGSYNGGTNTGTWNLGTVAANSGQSSVTLVVLIDRSATGMIRNSAELAFNTDRLVVAVSEIALTPPTPPDIKPVPTFSTAGLIILIILTLGVGFVAVRRVA